MANDSTLPPSLAAAQRQRIDHEDELPPWLGERLRDATYQIFRSAAEAALATQENAHD